MVDAQISFTSSPVTVAPIDSLYEYSLTTDADSSHFWIQQGPVWLQIQELPGLVSTVSGTGSQGNSGDGGLATNASMDLAWGAYYSQNGMLYSSCGGHVVRAINPQTGIIEHVAGSYQNSGFAGDGGLATAAVMTNPFNMVDGPDGALYVVEQSNGRVRSIDSSGIINTVVGSGATNFVGDSLAPLSVGIGPHDLAWDNNGNLYITDANNERIWKLDTAANLMTVIAGTGMGPAGGDSIPALSASIGSPSCMAIDTSTNELYFYAVSYVKKIDLNTNFLTNVAGTGTAGYNGDSLQGPAAQIYSVLGMEIGPEGDLWLAEVNGDIIRKLNLTTGMLTLQAGMPNVSGFSGDGGLPLDAHFDAPTHISFDPDGNLYVGDRQNHRVRKIGPRRVVLTGTPTCANAGIPSVVIGATNGVDSTLQTFVLTVPDGTPPTVDCPASIDTVIAPLQCGQVVTWQLPSSNDNCGVVTIFQTDTSTLTSGDQFPIGTTTIEYTVTDIGGNTGTCSFTINVVDTVSPSISCPNDTIIQATTADCGAAFTYTAAAGMDNCAGFSTIQSDNTGLVSGDIFPAGVTTLQFTVTDISGNQASCAYSVSVIDTIPPTLSCPDSIWSNNQLVTFAAPTAVDNCFGIALQQTDGTGLQSGDVFPHGTTNLEFTATDASGNQTQCIVPVIVDTSLSAGQNVIRAVEYKLFPNPSLGSITIEQIGYAASPVTYQVFGALGQVVAEGSFSAQQVTLDLHGEQAGMYYARLVSRQAVTIKRFVLK